LEQQLGAAPVEFHVAQLVQAEQIDPAVAGDRLGQDPFVGGLDEFVDELGGQDVLHPVPGHRRCGAQADQQVALAGAAVADQAERLALDQPGAGGGLRDDGGLDVRVRGVVEVLQPFLPREAGGGYPAGGAAPVAVVALGHQQLGEEPAVGQLLALRGVGDLGEPGPHRW